MKTELAHFLLTFPSVDAVGGLLVQHVGETTTYSLDAWEYVEAVYYPSSLTSGQFPSETGGAKLEFHYVIGPYGFSTLRTDAAGGATPIEALLGIPGLSFAFGIVPEAPPAFVNVPDSGATLVLSFLGCASHVGSGMLMRRFV